MEALHAYQDELTIPARLELLPAACSKVCLHQRCILRHAIFNSIQLSVCSARIFREAYL